MCQETQDGIEILGNTALFLKVFPLLFLLPPFPVLDGKIWKN